jgi:uncharacterized protein DUF4920
MRIDSVLLGALLVCCSCESGRVEVPGAAGAAAVKPAPVSGVRSSSNFGAAFVPGPEVALSALLANPGEYADKSVITEGKVQRACSAKGCWMEIGVGDDACRVTFKDYGFFVPTDSAGAQARIQGKLATRVVEAAAVQHLEAEGARFRHKRDDGSATEVRLIASAVQLQR